MSGWSSLHGIENTGHVHMPMCRIDGNPTRESRSDTRPGAITRQRSKCRYCDTLTPATLMTGLPVCYLCSDVCTDAVRATRVQVAQI